MVLLSEMDTHAVASCESSWGRRGAEAQPVVGSRVSVAPAQPRGPISPSAPSARRRGQPRLAQPREAAGSLGSLSSSRASQPRESQADDCSATPSWGLRERHNEKHGALLVVASKRGAAAPARWAPQSWAPKVAPEATGG